MNDLFDYPNSPGYRRTDTSKAAAADMKPKAGTIRAMVLDYLTKYGAKTADSVAWNLGLDKLAVRPRFSELREMGLIEDNGIRSPNASGKMAIVWRVI